MPSPPLGTSENCFDETNCQKWDFKPIYFAPVCPQNAGNAVSETQNSKIIFGGGERGEACSRTTLQFCRHYGLPVTKILATPLLLDTMSLALITELLNFFILS